MYFQTPALAIVAIATPRIHVTRPAPRRMQATIPSAAVTSRMVRKSTAGMTLSLGHLVWRRFPGEAYYSSAMIVCRASITVIEASTKIIAKNDIESDGAFELAVTTAAGVRLPIHA